MTRAEAILLVAGLYAGIGVLFALWFSVRGVHRLDPSAHGSHWAFRLLIIPGAAALWPLLLRKLVADAPTSAPSPSHADPAAPGVEP